jgi:hypothetical protein
VALLYASVSPSLFSPLNSHLVRTLLHQIGHLQQPNIVSQPASFRKQRAKSKIPTNTVASPNCSLILSTSPVRNSPLFFGCDTKVVPIEGSKPSLFVHEGVSRMVVGSYDQMADSEGEALSNEFPEDVAGELGSAG